MFTDITTYSKGDTERSPKVLEGFANNIRFTIHKHIYSGDEWLLSCRGLNIEKLPLGTEDMDEAKDKGVKTMIRKLRETIEKCTKAIEELEKKDEEEKQYGQ